MHVLHTCRIWAFHIVVLVYRGHQRYHVLRIITHVQSLFCSLNLLFSGFPVAVAVVGFVNSLISIPNNTIQSHLSLYFSYSSSCCSSQYLTKDVHFVSLASYIQHCPPRERVNFKLRFPFEFSNDVCSYIFISKQTWEGEIVHVKSDQIKRSFPNYLVSLFLNECLCKIFDLKWVWITWKWASAPVGEHIFIWMVSHKDSFWHRVKRQLGNGLFTCIND